MTRQGRSFLLGIDHLDATWTDTERARTQDVADEQPPEESVVRFLGSEATVDPSFATRWL